MKIRRQIKSTPYGSLLWRVFIGVVGGLITVIGSALLFAPGPGLLILLAGLGILATEFAWASKAIRQTKNIAENFSEKIGIPLWVKYLIAALLTLASLLAVAIYYS